VTLAKIGAFAQFPDPPFVRRAGRQGA